MVIGFLVAMPMLARRERRIEELVGGLNLYRAIADAAFELHCWREMQGPDGIVHELLPLAHFCVLRASLLVMPNYAARNRDLVARRDSHHRTERELALREARWNGGAR